MRELECFFQENCYLPPNKKIMVSDRFGDGELLWEIRAVREAELRKWKKKQKKISVRRRWFFLTCRIGSYGKAMEQKAVRKCCRKC